MNGFINKTYVDSNFTRKTRILIHELFNVIINLFRVMLLK